MTRNRLYPGSTSAGTTAFDVPVTLSRMLSMIGSIGQNSSLLVLTSKASWPLAAALPALLS